MTARGDALRAWAEGSALDLAVMRICVAAVILALPELRDAPGLAEVYAGRSLWGAVPVDPVAARVAWAVAMVGGALGLVGVVPRAAFTALALALAYLGGIAQLPSGTVHFHHLLWFAVVLAVAPSGDALAPGARGPWPRSVAHGLPVRAAWLLLGAVFFFPGLHKLLAQGPLWDPRDILYWKWAQSGISPPRVDLWGPALRVGGLLVVAFELGFGVAVALPRTRALGVAAALAFHAATAVFFGIHFSSLWLTYGVFVPWAALVGGAAGPDPGRDWRPVALVGGALLVGAAIPGLLGATQGWPFACYPTFAEAPGRSMPAIEFVVVVAAGERSLAPEVWAMDGQRTWGEAWAVTGVTGPVDPAGLERLWARIADRRGLVADEVRVYQATLDVTPGAPEPLTRGPLLHAFRP